jgi:hypothetical protein
MTFDPTLTSVASIVPVPSRILPAEFRARLKAIRAPPSITTARANGAIFRRDTAASPRGPGLD